MYKKILILTIFLLAIGTDVYCGKFDGLTKSEMDVWQKVNKKAMTLLVTDGDYMMLDEFKDISVFGGIYFFYEDDQTNKMVGLDQKYLQDYTKLRFKNNFADIKYNPEWTKIKDIGSSTVLRTVGAITISAWTVGEKYPIAYYINCKIWNMDESQDFYEDAFLGITSEEKVQETIKNCIDALIERSAVRCFKVKDWWTVEQKKAKEEIDQEKNKKK